MRADRVFDAAPPELFFILSAVAQYTGAIVAVRLFDDISPATVAWLRVLSAAFILLAFSARSSHARWNRRDLYWVAAFGASTALMNMFFY